MMVKLIKEFGQQRKIGNEYKGKASDVKGQAYGKANGFAFNWKYVLKINVYGKIWNINLDDWIYQLDSKRLINTTKMKKFGFEVDSITLLIEKV